MYKRVKGRRGVDFTGYKHRVRCGPMTGDVRSGAWKSIDSNGNGTCKLEYRVGSQIVTLWRKPGRDNIKYSFSAGGSLIGSGRDLEPEAVASNILRLAVPLPDMLQYDLANARPAAGASTVVDKWTYEYRGRPVTLFKKDGGLWSLRVEAEPKRGLKNASKQAVQKRLSDLGIDPRKGRSPKTSSGNQEPAGSLSAKAESAAILARVDARKTSKVRRPAETYLDWYDTDDYAEYCEDIGADPSVSRTALGAGVFGGKPPKHKLVESPCT